MKKHLSRAQIYKNDLFLLKIFESINLYLDKKRFFEIFNAFLWVLWCCFKLEMIKNVILFGTMLELIIFNGIVCLEKKIRELRKGQWSWSGICDCR
ncbi:hypothetical protein SDC9_199379 [bioreactor metagenome]|uniref:Uncharacterized protein n=1 Tax=bioreactor metagenome TaxID=1076179 RepID=A0A645IKV9_9ZZZZ